MSLLAITDAGVVYKDAVFAGEEVQNITRVIFRNIAGLIPETDIDLTQSVPSTDIVHSEPIELVSALDDNAVVMSTVLGYDVGDFEYNWYGVVAQKGNLSEVLIAVVQTPIQTKTKTDGATTGNYSVKSIVWKTANIAQSLSVYLSALPWQMAANTFVTKTAYDLAMAEKSNNSHNHDENYLGKTAKAESAITADDSEKFNGKLPAHYATKAEVDSKSANNHNHDSDYLGKTAKATSALLADNALLLAGRNPHHYRGLNNGGSTGDPNVATDQVILTNHANAPASGYFYITTTFYSAISTTGNRGQIATGYGSSYMYTRACYSGTWSAWVRCDNNDAALQPITGSNGSGTYVKFPNGTLICYSRVASNGTSTSTAYLMAHAFKANSNPVVIAGAGVSKLASGAADSNGINFYAWGQNILGAQIITTISLVIIGVWK